MYFYHSKNNFHINSVTTKFKPLLDITKEYIAHDVVIKKLNHDVFTALYLWIYDHLNDTAMEDW